MLDFLLFILFAGGLFSIVGEGYQGGVAKYSLPTLMHKLEVEQKLPRWLIIILSTLIITTWLSLVIMLGRYILKGTFSPFN
ncbi:hypothetical protein A3I27_01680 [Candidatus Giovannonibacteria bacterium RIFCSPLOWO2_02_FULL_43_11b]|uniref:Uncharacterized protein n=1 Tax=Candidatus Giovannonibacteria bacterium RIFCSPHIGHO2_12_FULL_43_15 TaxID=1798341 RepID=A0A1F5WQ77_9BACT|nr:MAG: hypothetical protein A3F23_03740 [Candidatus Giovannonibacteria bacterium RIFCSPHIGHO2_12_FULL_43_15]OGF89796.1 MAG: hypothetical protein A3I27_01680 [Candidatus Giovannonibacteria bacterium RIFCSPLOWO2_02_FULL_43_11b]OGF91994.1 MAG: hypothetical protein A3H04_04595 [Candidatus Giovannonibacteria bacterium RIFCSPLOWO2_12_FULL_43_11c]